MSTYKKNLFEPVFTNSTQGNQQQSQRSFSFAGSLNTSQNNANNFDRNDLMSYLEKDFKDPTPSKADDIPHKAEQLKTEMKNLQSILPAYGFPSIGDLFNASMTDIELTLRCVHAFLAQRQKDIDFRQEGHDKLQRLESDRNHLQQVNEKTAAQKKTLESDVEKYQNKIANLEKALREERDKHIMEKEDLTKQIVKLQNKEIQFQHELKSKDSNYKKLQDQLKRYAEKNVTYKNGVEITNLLETKGPTLFSGNSDSDFTKMISNAYEDVRNRLLAENEMLRESLAAIQRELGDILEQKKEIFFRRRKIELGEDNRDEYDFSQHNLLNLKKDLFEMPIQTVGKETLECLQENLKRFREYMTKLDVAHRDIDLEFNFDNAAETEKIKCVKSLRALLRNYKQIIDTQDALLNKSILKQGLIKNPEDFNYSGSRFKVLDEKELEKAKQFIIEQKRYLEEKGEEIEIAKRTMNETTKKLDEEKLLISQKRQEIEEETEKFRMSLNEIIAKNQSLMGEMIPEQDQENMHPNQLDFSLRNH